MQVFILLLLFKYFSIYTLIITEMKSILRLLLINILMICVNLVHSQENCKVLKPSISGTYEGKCKNGFANGRGIAVGTDRYEGQFSKGLPQGEGTYTWSDGNTYTGEWLEGMRHGAGKYTMHLNGKDSIQSGLWKNDTYAGPKPKEPVVTYKTSIDRYNFRKNITPLNRVLVDIYQNGARNKGISNFRMSSSSGQDVQIGPSIGYDNVVFPVAIKIGYTTMNKLNSSQSIVYFEFTIFEPGDWTVELHN